MEKIWEAKLAKHRGEERIAVYFKKDPDLIARIKKLEGARWSPNLMAWHLPDTEENRVRFKIPLKVVLHPDHAAKIASFRMWMQSKRLSENTIQVYIEALRVFLLFFNEKSVHEMDYNDIIRFNNEYVIANKLSLSYQNQIINAVKKFFQTIEHHKMNFDYVHRPKREKALPNVLSKEEVKLILEAHSNLKHRVMLSLIYSSGLRCGELLALQPQHIDSKRQLILIKKGKGKKDRIVPLSQKILDLLREYYKLFKPKLYLFEGQQAGTPYDARSLQLVLKQALDKVQIKKPVTLHWLRHSYATHLLENGTDLRYIQEILGHSSSKTTEIYTHVSTKSIQKIISPFDTM
ncbi:MAG: site-specific integrase [Chitinophagales bacterium]|nr:site-specific integrase [Chitinophagales bacterium]